MAIAGWLVACGGDDDRNQLFGSGGEAGSDSESNGSDADGETGGPNADASGQASDADETGAGDGLKLDVGVPPGDSGECPEGDPNCGPIECDLPAHQPCDEAGGDPLAAIGLACPNEALATGTLIGDSRASGVLAGFGSTAEWAPTEGAHMMVIGSGLVEELSVVAPDGDNKSCPTACNDDLDVADLGCEGEGRTAQLGRDPGLVLPAPLRTNDVAGDCLTNPALVGTGDCSKTIAGQYFLGFFSFDFTAFDVSVTVPPDVTSVGFDVAYLSTEYPVYYNLLFNDMFVGWLESEGWTGNVSFDAMGNPISLNAAFLDFRDDFNSAPELAGTCMRGHGGTGWLRSTAPVAPGEQIRLVFAIFDLADTILDSYAFIDNVGWGCEGQDGPQTGPVG